MLYEGSWTGKYADNKTFKITVSNVTGFRAKVQYQSGGTNKFQEVLIKDNSFRIGDTKFTLTELGKAQIKNVVTDPSSGQTFLDQAFASVERLDARPSVVDQRPEGSSLAVGGAQARAARPWSGRGCGNRRGGAARLPRETA